MSAEHPIIAITGASGSGTNAVTEAFEHILFRIRAQGVYIQGNAFHRYDRQTMNAEQLKADREGHNLTHFGPEGNMLDKLDSLFFQYAATGTGKRRYYLHSTRHAESFGQEAGTFTDWEDIEPGSDLLIYKGLHGGAIDGDIDLTVYPDLLIGMVPNVNLEWIRRIARDTSERGYSVDEVRKSILRRLPDYVTHITPQFSRTHINFQTVSTIDTSDPFNQDFQPTDEECYIVIHDQKKMIDNMPTLVKKIPNAFMSRSDTLVVPGGTRMVAIELIFLPLVKKLVEKGRELRGDRPRPLNFEGGLQGLI